MRIQRKRTKGWQMPKNTVYVGRPTKWGNPFIIGNKWNLECALIKYRQWLLWKIQNDPDFLKPLQGKDLACWCNLTEACHADILLELLRS